MSFLSLVGVEFKKIKRSKIFLILFAATVIYYNRLFFICQQLF